MYGVRESELSVGVSDSIVMRVCLCVTVSRDSLFLSLSLCASAVLRIAHVKSESGLIVRLP